METHNDLEYFSRVPWCRQHLEEPGITTILSPSCSSKQDGEDELIARTLRTTNTIRGFLAMYKLPVSPETEIIREVKYLISLQSGLAGWPGVCHGGIVATILDEVLGLIFNINLRHNNLLGGNKMTGKLTTTYLRPVPLRCALLCRARLVKIDGRKFFVDGHIEDENGNILAKGESVFISLKVSGKPKL